MPSGSASNGSVLKNRRHHRPASAPTGTAPPPAAEEAEARQGEARAPEPADSAERYYPAVPVSVGSASGSSPRPVPAEGVLAVKAPADWVPGSAAVAIPAA